MACTLRLRRPLHSAVDPTAAVYENIRERGKEATADSDGRQSMMLIEPHLRWMLSICRTLSNISHNSHREEDVSLAQIHLFHDRTS